MKKTFIATFAVVFAFGVLFSVSAIAEASHSWGPYHWARTANPFTLKLGDNVSSAWDAYLATASADWSQSNVLDTVVTAGLVSPRTCKGTTGRIEVCNSKYGNNGWLGLASIWINSGSHITKGTAKMNDTYFTTATYNTPAWRRLVMCQEVAHGFGLAHQDETFNNANLGSCMDYTNDPDGGAGGVSAVDPSNEHPNAHDFAQLEAIYAHLDATTSVGQVDSGGAGNGKGKNNFGMERADAGGANASEHAEFGLPIGYDGHGRANEFRKDVGGGESVITHVFWLPE